MSKEKKALLVAKEFFGSMKGLNTGTPINISYEMDNSSPPLMLATRHVIPFWNEVYSWLSLSFTTTPPAGEAHIDVGETFSVDVTVTNNRNVTYGNYPLLRFKDIYLIVGGTSYANLTTSGDVGNMFILKQGAERLNEGQSVNKLLQFEALQAVNQSTDPIEKFAHFTINAVFDWEAYFHVHKHLEAFVQIRTP